MLVTLWSGLTLGAVYATVALGFTLSMLPSGVFNFAQGAIVVTGTYVTYAVLEEDLGIVALIGVNALVGVALGMLCEVLCVRPLQRGGHVLTQRNELLTTIGLSTAIVGVVGLLWGYLPLAVPFAGGIHQWHLLDVVVQLDQVVVLVGAVAAAVTLHHWFRRTRHGQACLAVAEDRDEAALRGAERQPSLPGARRRRSVRDTQRHRRRNHHPCDPDARHHAGPQRLRRDGDRRPRQLPRMPGRWVTRRRELVARDRYLGAAYDDLAVFASCSRPSWCWPGRARGHRCCAKCLKRARQRGGESLPRRSQAARRRWWSPWPVRPRCSPFRSCPAMRTGSRALSDRRPRARGQRTESELRLRRGTAVRPDLRVRAGCYLTMGLAIHVWNEVVALVVIGGLAAAAVGAALGLLASRVGGWPLVIVSLFLIIAIPDLVALFPGATGGLNGLIDIPEPQLFGRPQDSRGLYTITVVAAIAWFVSTATW